MRWRFAAGAAKKAVPGGIALEMKARGTERRRGLDVG